jgi:phosphotransacetylase
MRFISNVIEKLQRHPKRVVFPEGEEVRILQAARQFYALRQIFRWITSALSIRPKAKTSTISPAVFMH